MNKKTVLLTVEVIAILLTAVVILYSGAKDKVQYKVGLILTGAKDDRGWNNAHYDAAAAAAENMGANLIVRENIPEGTGECIAVLDDMINAGVTTVFLAGYAYGEDIRDYSKVHKNVRFYVDDPSSTSENIYSYYGRIYQARYLTGIIAGYMTKTKSIGYVAAMKTPEVVRGINAFTMGARSVVPDLKVYVKWINSWEDEEKEKNGTYELIDKYNIDVITYHQNRTYCVEIAEMCGIYSIGYHYDNSDIFSENYLTSAVWNFEELYDKCMADENFNSQSPERITWGDISMGIVDIGRISPVVPEAAIQKVEETKERFAKGYDVFSNEIYDNEGNLRVNYGEKLSDNYLLYAISWLVDGVEEVQ